MDSLHTDVVVIGAGQAGLAAAYYLHERAIPTIILDRGPRSGGAWQHRWEALRLDRAHRVNDLPGMDRLGLSFATAPGELPARDIVADYYSRYERAYNLPIRRPVLVTAVHPEADRLLVTTENSITGQPGVNVSARIVVNASGTWERPFRPEIPGSGLFGGRQLDTPDYRSAAEFAGKRVLIVGGGTSAIGFVLDIAPVAHTVAWATRRPVDFRPEDNLSLEHGRAAVAEQDQAAREGSVLPSIVSGTGVPLTAAMAAGREAGILRERPMFRELTPTGVIWSDGTREEFDVILWSTGFRAELDHLAPLGVLNPDGGIRVEAGRATEEPRLFLAGYGPQASTIGAARAGRATARDVAAALASTPVTL